MLSLAPLSKFQVTTAPYSDHESKCLPHLHLLVLMLGFWSAEYTLKEQKFDLLFLKRNQKVKCSLEEPLFEKNVIK